MHWRFRDCEADAREMRDLARVGHDEIVAARDIGRAAEIVFAARAACGCRAEVRVEEMRVYLHFHGHPWTQNYGNAHELAHFIRALNLGAWPHDEDRADWTALALLMPRAVTLAAVRRFGLRNPRALVQAFPDVPPTRVILRAAWVWGCPVAVHRDRERLVWAPEGFPVPERGTLWEQSLVRDVRTSGRWQKNLTGAVGLPLGDHGADGVVVLLPEALAASGW